MATSLAPAVRKKLTPYVKLFMSRTFPTINEEWRDAESQKRAQRVHGDSKSTQPQENGDPDNFFTSHILYLQKSGGEGQRAIAFVTGTFYASKKVQWQVPLPDVPDVDLVAAKTDGGLAAIIKKAVKEAFLAAGGDEDDIE